MTEDRRSAPSPIDGKGHAMADQSMPAAQTGSISTLGSPFVIGRPLRADEPIFGRDEVFRFVANSLRASVRSTSWVSAAWGNRPC